MRQGLIKKQIRDKNGKSTHVWVKTGDDDKSKLKFNLLKAEKSILLKTKNEFESGILVNEKGEILYEQGGEKSKVRFTDEQCQKMYNNILTHNHPSSRCFSLTDIGLALHTGLKEIRAIAPKSADGNVTYVFRRGKLDKGQIEQFITNYKQVENTIIRPKWDSKIQEVMEKGDFEAQKIINEANLKHPKDVLEYLFNHTEYGYKIKKQGAEFKVEQRP